jgi:hypothetical protein
MESKDIMERSATTPRKLLELYKRGENISALLRKEQLNSQNTERIIEVSYDLQTGSYIADMERDKRRHLKVQYAAEIADIIRSLCTPKSLLEAGVGEATTLAEVLGGLKIGGLCVFGFDLSWSRVAYAKRYLADRGFSDVILCTASLFQIPLSDSSVDVVYTSHTIEPNGGNEEPILKELYRVAGKYLVLVEPGYELADEEAQKRMRTHGYCRGLKETAERLGYEVVNQHLLSCFDNLLNPSAVTVIRKEGPPRARNTEWVCPEFKTALEPINGMLFSAEALAVYPVVGDIPCLRIENAIVASKYKEMSH